MGAEPINSAPRCAVDCSATALKMRSRATSDGSSAFQPVICILNASPMSSESASTLGDVASFSPTSAASEETLRVWLRKWEEDGFSYWAVRLLSAPEIIGFGDVRRMTWRDRDILNLYYRFAPAAWGHGYAAEVAREAASLARAHLPMLPIVARVRAENVASIRTAERSGLSRRPDLDTTDHLVYALGWPAMQGEEHRA